AVVWFWPQLLSHERHNVRLRNGLAVTDWQRPVFITASTRVRRNEFFAWYFPHRGENPCGVDTACRQLLLNHDLALSCKIGKRRRSLPATRRDNRSKNQKLRNASHPAK